MHHTILALGEGCNTSLMSVNFSKAHFDTSCVPRDLASSLIDHAYIMYLACARLTLLMCVHLSNVSVLQLTGFSLCFIPWLVAVKTDPL